jgi:hypothetical protein
MKTSKSERVRMAAALRLADVLTLREQREITELRSAQRRVEAETPTPITPEPPETVDGQVQPPDVTVDVQKVWREIERGLLTVKGGDYAV